MTKEEQIEIPLGKTKMILAFWGSVLFVAGGIWFIAKALNGENSLLGQGIVFLIIEVVSVLFFGLGVIVIFGKLLDKKPGLIINKKGIVDNSSGVAAGLIPWTDIQEIELSEIMDQKFLMFKVKNPEYYLNKVKNPIKRKAMKMNYKMYGSPISISSNTLKTNMDDLQKLLVNKMNEYKL